MKTLLLCGALAAIAGPALAGSGAQSLPSDVRQVVVRYDDLDLDRPRDAGIMIARIQKAAHEVCDPARFSGRFGALESRGCLRSAIGDAFDQLGVPFVAAQVGGVRVMGAGK